MGLKQKRQTAKAKQQADVDRWLLACDEMLEGMIESAGLDRETRRALGAIFVNKAFRVLHKQEQPTLH